MLSGCMWHVEYTTVYVYVSVYVCIIYDRPPPTHTQPSPIAPQERNHRNHRTATGHSHRPTLPIHTCSVVSYTLNIIYSVRWGCIRG